MMFWKRIAFAFLVLCILSVAQRARAIEIPPPGSPTYIQTNGPDTWMGRGDWYTSDENGVIPGYHFFVIHVPCDWPNNLDMHFDLFSAEMNFNSFPLKDEDDTPGTTGDTFFEIYAPGTAVAGVLQPHIPGPGAPGSLFSQNFPPSGALEQWTRFYTLTPPFQCGPYLLRAGTSNDDQNGWRLRVGWDNDNNPNNAPPATLDNPDGALGTNDEIAIGLSQTAYQHDETVSTRQCLTIYEFVVPDAPQVAFHNFDLDNASRVTYYPEGDPTYHPQGITGGIPSPLPPSANNVWNGGSSTDRGTGDIIANPPPGWWRIVTCASDHNQYIQEGQSESLTYFAQPPTPRMTLTKDDGVVQAVPEQILTYVLTFANVSNVDPNPGAALNVILRDTIPPNTTYRGCTINAPYTGTCGLNNGIVTFTINETVVAGASGTLTVIVEVNPGAVGDIINNATLDYVDMLDNTYPTEQAQDIDTVLVIPKIDVSVTTDKTTVTVGDTITYTIIVTNTGNVPLDGIQVNDPILGNITLPVTTLRPGESVTVVITYVVRPGDLPLKNAITVTADSISGVSTATSVVSVVVPPTKEISVPASSGVRTGDGCLFKLADPPFALPGQSVTWTVFFSNGDLRPMQDILILDTVPAEMQILGVSPSIGAASVSGQSIRYTLSSLDPGATASFQIFTRIRDDARLPYTLVNTARLVTPVECDASARVLGVNALPVTGETPWWRAWIVAGLLSAPYLLMVGCFMWVLWISGERDKRWKVMH